MSRRLFVTLTGGLGNQLFQLSAALSFANGADLFIDYGILKPRVDSGGIPELFSIKLPTNVKKFRKSYSSILVKKFFGYLLRTGVNPKGYENFRVFKTILRIACSLIATFRAKTFLIASQGVGVGWSDMNLRGKNNHLVGYFQSYLWARSLKSFITQSEAISIRDYTEFSEYSLLAKKEMPLVVHVRLGDYLTESDFGIPERRYYLEAISKLFSTGRYGKIWLFSDDTEEALERIPLEFHPHVRVMPNFGLPSSRNLDLMRLGHGYVIANSTFSWWGAFLSMNHDAKVIAPTPWFKNLPTPTNLIPPEWETHNAFLK